ncbi:hypothetical protein B0H13DRAFT_1551248, partial [Mycena leptocephala]
TYIQYTLEVYRNMNFRHMPVELVRKQFFGQVRKFIVLTVPSEFPAQRDATDEERVQSSRNRTIIFAAVAEVTLTRKNAVGMVYFNAKSSDLGPASEVIDVGSIDCLAGRIYDLKRWACLVR